MPLADGPGIPVEFLSHACEVLADTPLGFSGPEIVRVTSATAAEQDVLLPHPALRFFFTALFAVAAAGCSGANSGNGESANWPTTTGMSSTGKDKVADTQTLMLVSYSREIEAAPDIVESIQSSEDNWIPYLTRDIAVLKSPASAQMAEEDVDRLKTQITRYDSMIRKDDDMLGDALHGEGRVTRFDEAILQHPCLNRPQTPSCTNLSTAIARYSKIRTIAIQNTRKAVQFLQSTAAQKQAIHTVVESYGGTVENPTGKK